jgi:hypothetical protein
VLLEQTQANIAAGRDTVLQSLLARIPGASGGL